MFGSKKRKQKREREEQERQRKAASDARARAEYEKLRKLQEEILRQQRRAPQPATPSSSSILARLDEYGRFPTDERGFVKSDKGGPVVFATARDAAVWIVKQGNKISPIQTFQHQNHPFMKAYTVQVLGHSGPEDTAAREAKAKAEKKEYSTAFQKAAAPRSAGPSASQYAGSLQEQLHKAAVNNDAAAANHLLRQGAVPAARTLDYVVGKGWTQWAEVFIDHGARPTIRTLHTAVVNNDADTTNLLMRNGVVAAAETLDYVVADRRTAWAKAFIDNGTKPTAETLHIATLNNDTATANLLMQRGVVPATKTLNYVVDAGWKQWAKVFINNGAKPTPETLHSAVVNNDIETGNLLLSKGVIPSTKSLNYVKEKCRQNWIDGLSKVIAANQHSSPRRSGSRGPR